MLRTRQPQLARKEPLAIRANRLQRPLLATTRACAGAGVGTADTLDARGSTALGSLLHPGLLAWRCGTGTHHG
eukprot:140449-Chlamydomonas_euryale.AAC.9